MDVTGHSSASQSILHLLTGRMEQAHKIQPKNDNKIQPNMSKKSSAGFF